MRHRCQQIHFLRYSRFNCQEKIRKERLLGYYQSSKQSENGVPQEEGTGSS